MELDRRDSIAVLVAAIVVAIVIAYAFGGSFDDPSVPEAIGGVVVLLAGAAILLWSTWEGARPMVGWGLLAWGATGLLLGPAWDASALLVAVDTACLLVGGATLARDRARPGRTA